MCNVCVGVFFFFHSAEALPSYHKANIYTHNVYEPYQIYVRVYVREPLSVRE